MCGFGIVFVEWVSRVDRRAQKPLCEKMFSPTCLTRSRLTFRNFLGLTRRCGGVDNFWKSSFSIFTWFIYEFWWENFGRSITEASTERWELFHTSQDLQPLRRVSSLFPSRHRGLLTYDHSRHRGFLAAFRSVVASVSNLLSRVAPGACHLVIKELFVVRNLFTTLSWTLSYRKTRQGRTLAA